MTKLVNTWSKTSKERNAKNENNDCGVRAIAAASGKSYEIAHKFAEEVLDRKSRKGTSIRFFKQERVQKESAKILGCNFLPLHKLEKRVLWEVNGIQYTRKPAAPIKSKPVTIHLSEAMYTVYTCGVVEENRTVARMALKTFLKLYPTGTYLVTISKHCFTIIDGVVHGNRDDAKRLKAIILQAWEVKPVAKKKKRPAKRKALKVA